MTEKEKSKGLFKRAMWNIAKPVIKYGAFVAFGAYLLTPNKTESHDIGNGQSATVLYSPSTKAYKYGIYSLPLMDRFNPIRINMDDGFQATFNKYLSIFRKKEKTRIESIVPLETKVSKIKAVPATLVKESELEQQVSTIDSDMPERTNYETIDNEDSNGNQEEGRLVRNGELTYVQPNEKSWADEPEFKEQGDSN